MRLSDALRIRQGDVVGFVGAGGKSTAIRVLTTELSSQFPVIVTTTTKIGLDQEDLAKKHLILSSPRDLEMGVENLQHFDSVLVTMESDPKESKWRGLDLNSIHKLTEIARREGAVLLVEADGARGRSLKAPAAYEPVLPPDCDLVVPVVGLDVIGEKLSVDNIHRPDLLKEVLGKVAGDTISYEHVVKLLRSSQGGLKGIPSSSFVRVLLNKADSEEDLENGRCIAVKLIEDPRIRSVLLASVVEEKPVKESISRVAGVILAAGSSSRIKGLKQIISFRGKPLIVHAVRAALGGGLDPVVVVVGEGGEAIREALKAFPIRIVENPQPERGQSGSVRVGMEALGDQIEAIIFLLADMPLISSDLIQALVKAHQQTLSPVIVPLAGGRRGNPVLFDHVAFEALQRLEGDQGGRAVFKHFPPTYLEWDDTILFDIDSEEDLLKLRELK